MNAVHRSSPSVGLAAADAVPEFSSGGDSSTDYTREPESVAASSDSSRPFQLSGMLTS